MIYVFNRSISPVFCISLCIFLLCSLPVIANAANAPAIINPSTLYNPTSVTCTEGTNDGDTGMNLYTPDGTILAGGWSQVGCTDQLNGNSLYTGADFGGHAYGDWHLVMFYGDDIACNSTDYATCIGSGDPLSNQTITVVDSDAPPVVPPFDLDMLAALFVQVIISAAIVGGFIGLMIVFFG